MATEIKAKGNALKVLRGLVNIAGYVVGLIMMVVGATMFLNAFVKVYVFGFTMETWQTPEEFCDNEKYAYTRVLSDADDAEDDKKMTEEEYDECVEKKTTSMKREYTRRKQENMIDGGISLLVGSLVLFAHRNRRRKDEEGK